MTQEAKQELAPAEQGTDIAAQPNQETAMLSMIERAAKDPNVDIDKMERMWAMYREMQKSKAEQEYASAMAEVQSKVPAIERKAHNQQTGSNYAKLEHICQKLTPIATEYGFSISYGTGKAEADGEIRTVATVYHSGGHSREYYVDLPPDNVGIKGSVNKTAVHARKSSLTYGRVILLGLIFNVQTVEADDDGNGAGKGAVKYITENQAADLESLADEVGADKAAFLRYISTQCNTEIKRFADIPEKAHKIAVSALESKRKAAKGAK